MSDVEEDEFIKDRGKIETRAARKQSSDERLINDRTRRSVSSDKVISRTRSTTPSDNGDETDNLTKRKTRTKRSQPTLEEPPESPFFGVEDEESLDVPENNQLSVKEHSPLNHDDSSGGPCYGFEVPEAENDLSQVEQPISFTVKPSEKETPIRRRGRPSKGLSKKSLHKLPAAAVSDLPDYLKAELQHAYEIYLALRGLPKIAPFIDKPSFNTFGMTSYYNIVKTPMWLDEVKRKLLSKGYDCISQFISDIRLMLENCYRFWGQEHEFSKKGLQIEAKLEQKIQELPVDIRAKCEDVTLNCDLIKMEPDDFRSSLIDDANVTGNNDFRSKIIDKIRSSTESNESLTPDIDDDKREEILRWERNHLVNSYCKDDINSVWELAAIGIFLNETHDYLNIPKIRQYEVERMILMPKESVTLATLMTTLLCPSKLHNKLDSMVPIMSYQVWNVKLKEKVNEWFSVYYSKNGSETEAFDCCGVEPYFWKRLSYKNIYEDKEFSQMTFQHKSAIIKALCDNLCKTIKEIEDIITDECLDEVLEYTKETVLGHMDCYTYFFLPFWPDLRIYRSKSISAEEFQANKNLGFISKKLLTFMIASRTQTNNVVKSEIFDEFSLVGDSLDDLFALTEQVKNTNMSPKLRSFNLQAKKRSRSYIHVLNSMYDQWSSYSERIKSMDSESLKYWVPNDNFGLNIVPDKGYFDVKDPQLLGKRTRKPVSMSSFNDIEDSSEEEEETLFDPDDEGSDYECPTEKKKSKKVPKEPTEPKAKKPTEPKTKKSTEPKKKKKSKKKLNDNEGTTTSTDIVPSIDKVVSLSLDKKSEDFIDDGNVVIKTELDNVTIKTEEHDIHVDENIQTKTAHNEVNIKKEINIKPEMSNEPIILLSSDDENDDVVMKTPTKQIIKPPSQVSTPVTPRQPLINGQPPNMNVNNMMRGQSPRVRSPMMLNQRLQSPTNRNPLMTPTNRTPSPRMPFSPSTLTPRQMSPRIAPNISPRQRQGYTPPMNSPRMRNMSPRFSQIPNRPNTPVSKNLFNNGPPQPNTGGIQAKVSIGKRHDGNFGYIARLPDGGVINLSQEQIDKIKKKHGGIPPVITIPI